MFLLTDKTRIGKKGWQIQVNGRKDRIECVDAKQVEGPANEGTGEGG